MGIGINNIINENKMDNKLLNKVMEALSLQFLKIINEKSKDEKK